MEKAKAVEYHIYEVRNAGHPSSKFDLPLFFSTALYSVILFCVFFWIPFVYFYYEEKDDDDTSKCTVSCLKMGLLPAHTTPSSVLILGFPRVP